MELLTQGDHTRLDVEGTKELIYNFSGNSLKAPTCERYHLEDQKFVCELGSLRIMPTDRP